jgi:hypothetical protein
MRFPSLLPHTLQPQLKARSIRQVILGSILNPVARRCLIVYMHTLLLLSGGGNLGMCIHVAMHKVFGCMMQTPVFAPAIVLPRCDRFKKTLFSLSGNETVLCDKVDRI